MSLRPWPASLVSYTVVQPDIWVELAVEFYIAQLADYYLHQGILQPQCYESHD
jgi:hypothetical protein